MREMLTGGRRRRLVTLATVAVTGLSVVGIGLLTTSGAGAANAHHEPPRSHPQHEARCRPPHRHGNEHHRVHHHRSSVPLCRPEPTTTSRPERSTTSLPKATTSVPVTTTTVPETTTTVAPTTTTTASTVQPCPGHIVNGVCIITG